MLLAMGLAGAAAQAPGDLRVALVIGNGAYPGAAALVNPANDARAMGEALRGLGFSVVELRDGSKARMTEAIAQLQSRLQGARGIGLVYYAGHGVQYDWRNFLVPVDAALKVEGDIPLATVDVAAVLDAFRAAGNRLNLVILDACRDNPFDNKLATKGLAPVDAPPGTFMAFATTPGNVADDGDPAARNGLYTQYLLQELRKPDSRVEDVFARVKLQVQQATRGRQIPSESTNLDEVFSFDRGFRPADAARRSARAENFAAEKAAWDRIKASQSADDFFDFLRRFPNGFVSEVARFRVNQLQKPSLVAQARRDGVTTLASGANRYAVGDEYTLIVTDLSTRKVRSEPQRVTFANDERVEINGGATVFNQLGGLIQDDSGLKDPPVQMVPADIALGKKWSSSFQNTVASVNIQAFVDFRTVALETLDIQGSTLTTYKVSMEGGAGPVVLTGTLWIEPSTMRLVRWDRRVVAPGKLLDASRFEYADYRPARR